MYALPRTPLLRLQKITEDVEKSLLKEAVGETKFAELPEDGLSVAEIEPLLKRWSEKDAKHWQSGQVSGAVYHGGDDVIDIAVLGTCASRGGEAKCAPRARSWPVSPRRLYAVNASPVLGAVVVYVCCVAQRLGVGQAGDPAVAWCVCWCGCMHPFRWWRSWAGVVACIQRRSDSLPSR